MSHLSRFHSFFMLYGQVILCRVHLRMCVYVCVCVFLNHSFIDGHLSCLAIVSNASVNIRVHIMFVISLDTESELLIFGKFFLINFFFRKCNTIFHSGSTNLHFQLHCKSDPFSSPLHQHLLFLFLFFF